MHKRCPVRQRASLLKGSCYACFIEVSRIIRGREPERLGASFGFGAAASIAAIVASAPGRDSAGSAARGTSGVLYKIPIADYCLDLTYLRGATREPKGTDLHIQGPIPEFGTAEPRGDYVLRHGAYGIIRGEAGRIAIVRTPGGIFLPGGGQDPGESLEQALVREVLEECGFHVRVGAFVGAADELAQLGEEKKFYRKRCAFFHAAIREDERCTPKEAD